MSQRKSQRGKRTQDRIGEETGEDAEMMKKLVDELKKEVREVKNKLEEKEGILDSLVTKLRNMEKNHDALEKECKKCREEETKTSNLTEDMSQKKSQRGKKLEDVVEDLSKEVCEIRMKMEKKEEEVRKLRNVVVNMEIEGKKDKADYKRCMKGWENEYKIRQQVVEELVASETEKKKMDIKLETLIRRWNVYEARIQEKDQLISSEIRKNSELKTRIEELELRMVCWESEKDEKDKQLERKKQKDSEINMVQFIELETSKDENKEDDRSGGQEVGKGRKIVNISRNGKNGKKSDEGKGKGKGKILLIGDVSNKTAREFCKVEGFGAWPLPGIDIDNLEKMIRNSKKAETESPEELLIYVGREDVQRNDKTENIVKNLGRLIKTAKEKYGREVKINVCKWSNYIGRYLNEQMDKLCDEEKVNMIRINPRWEMEDLQGEKREIREKAIGIAIKKAMTVGQKPKEYGWGFRPVVFWKKKL
jgi:hypothetical protein